MPRFDMDYERDDGYDMPAKRSAQEVPEHVEPPSLSDYVRFAFRHFIEEMEKSPRYLADVAECVGLPADQLIGTAKKFAEVVSESVESVPEDGCDE